MFKIPVRDSLNDFQNIAFDYTIQESTKERSARKLKSSIMPSIQSKLIQRVGPSKTKMTSIQNLFCKKSPLETQLSDELNLKQAEQVGKVQRCQEFIKNEALMQLNSGKLKQKLKRRRNKNDLKQTVSFQKINKLKLNFVQKIKRNNIHAQPLAFEVQSKAYLEVLDLKGIQINQSTGNLIISVFILNFIAMLFVSSITIPFKDLRQNDTAKTFQLVGLSIYFAEIVLNLVTVRFSLGRKLETLGEITQDYAKQSLFVDLLTFLTMLLNSVTYSQVELLNLCKIFMLFKLPNWFQKIKKLQVYVIQNYYKQQYWSLAKVFLFNFLYAHMLSIVLLCMADVNPGSNWITEKGLIDASWYQQYIWSYYWSTTIMLTIGFGDITPHCYQQALIMIFIQTVSCVILAYNINCVGMLINNIRMQDEEKHKNLKIFKKLAQKNKVSEQLNWKINNFIEEHSNIKKLTNIDQEAKFVENLPPNYKAEYLKQSNKIIFKGLYFFNSLMEKTLCALAENIMAKITHPLQVLLSSQTNYDLLILKDGEIGCKSNKGPNLAYSNILINILKVSKNDRPFLLHTNFITNRRSNYKIVSNVYSLLYYLNYQSLLNTLREFAVDFELYCQLRDKCMYYIDEYEVFLCKKCKTKHTDFECPKHHFMPIKEHVIHKELALQKRSRNGRHKTFFRLKRPIKQISQPYFVYFNTKNQITSLQTFQKMHQNINRDEQGKRFENLNGKYIYNILRRKRTAAGYNQQDSASLSYKNLQQKLTQTLKVHLGQILGNELYQDKVWLIESDRMKNYKMYFFRDNPQNLSEKFSLDKRERILGSNNVDWSQFKDNTTNYFTKTLKSSQELNGSQQQKQLTLFNVILNQLVNYQ